MYKAEAPEGGSMDYAFTDSEGNRFEVKGAAKAYIKETAKGSGVGFAAEQALEKVASKRDGILGGSVEAGLDTYSAKAQEEVVASIVEGVVEGIKP